jgi:hypothetical protein
VTSEEAKARAREQVRAAFQERPIDAPARTCPTCGTVSATYSSRCPACNKRYDRRWPWLTDRMRWALAGLALVAVIVAAIVIVPKLSDTRERISVKERREQAARVASERARLIREQRPVRGRASGTLKPPAAGASDAEKLTARRALVGALEAAILTEARGRVARRQLDGPIRSARCEPLVRASGRPRDEEVLTKRRGRYDCVVVKRDVVRDGKVVAYFGHPFVATLDFKRFTWVFCKDNKLPGERGKALAKVALDPACLGAEGAEPIGDGYLTPDE